MDELLARDHKQIENEIIEVIITFQREGDEASGHKQLHKASYCLLQNFRYILEHFQN